VDLDRKDLSKQLRVSERPLLELGERGTFDEFGTYPASVIRNGKDVLLYYGGWTRCESVPFNVAIGLARSKDGGTTFQRYGSGPLLSYTPDEPFVLSGPKIRRFNDRWALWYIAGQKWIATDGRAEPVYKIRMALSDDGQRWTRINRNLITNKLDDEAQASPDVFFAHGAYHMFFCYRPSLSYRKNGYRIGYASSEDMMTWVRDDAKTGIDVSDAGWDSEMISYPHVFELDERVFMLYGGNQVGKEGFGLAELEGILQ
jgi:sucrose-6-phosphate hydrolase SacC (GH32 family)